MQVRVTLIFVQRTGFRFLVFFGFCSSLDFSIYPTFIPGLDFCTVVALIVWFPQFLHSILQRLAGLDLRKFLFNPFSILFFGFKKGLYFCIFHHEGQLYSICRDRCSDSGNGTGTQHKKCRSRSPQRSINRLRIRIDRTPSLLFRRSRKRVRRWNDFRSKR